MNRMFLVTMLAISTGGVASSAEQLQDVFPHKGAWAKYDFIFTEEGRKQSGTLELRLVGTVTKDGGECHWLEMEFIDEKDVKKKRCREVTRTGQGVFGRLPRDQGTRRMEEEGWQCH